MKIVITYLRPYFKRMSLGLTIKFTGTIMDLLLPAILAHIIDNVAPTGDRNEILFWGGAMLVCSVLAVVTNIAANRMASWVAMNTTRAVRHDLFSKIMCLSCRQIDELTIPSLESRLTTDTYNVHHMIGMMQRLGVRAPILLLGGIIITYVLEPVLTLVLAATLPFIGILVWRVTKRGVPLYTRLQQGIDDLVLKIRENVSGSRVIKALSKTEYEKERFEAINQEVVSREKKAGMTMAITNPMMNILLNLGLTAVIVVGSFRVNDGLTQPGTIIAFLTYFTLILNAMMAITRIFIGYSKASASSQRISEVLHMPDDFDVKPDYNNHDKAHIVFDNVSFSYHKQKDNVSNISFRLNKGETLGIIGATGSGKSTIIHLLMRLYEADSGEILIDGKPITSIDSKELYNKFGVAFQNDVLFADTIRENINFGRSLSDEDIDKAAEFAEAKEFISALAAGFEHKLAIKGMNLSGGQRQRLLIARALAGKPEILILDDSSSALDYKTDSLIRQAINTNLSGTTTVIVAQRISSILHSDHILVIDDGKEIGYGTHSELIKTCEVYKEIFISQMGGGEIAS